MLPIYKNFDKGAMLNVGNLQKLARRALLCFANLHKPAWGATLKFMPIYKNLAKEALINFDNLQEPPARGAMLIF